MNRNRTSLNRALAPLLIPLVTLVMFWVGDRNVYPLCVRFKDVADRAIACPLVLPTPFAVVAFLIALAGLTSSALRLYRHYKIEREYNSKHVVE